MTLKDQLQEKVEAFAIDSWGSIPNAYVLPDEGDLTFGNSGERLNVTVLYADIAGSTTLVDEESDTGAAEYYKAFLHCASQLVTFHDGKITAYDGDRVMAMFVGADRADRAVKAALNLHYVVENLINPIFQDVYKENHRPLQFTVGIDSGQVLAVKVGVRAVGELAWIGAAANYAAKLNSFTGLDHAYPIRVTQETMDLMTDATKLGSDGSIWSGPYVNVGKRRHYRTDYWRTLV